jgi:cell wall-associated NlpC family hydrolase
MSLTQAAQKVQRSAYPDAYAKHESSAMELMGASSGGAHAPGVPAVPAMPATTSALKDPTAGFSIIEDLDDQSSGFGAPFLPKMELEEFAETFGSTQLPGGPFDRPVAPVAASGMRKRIIDNAMQYIGQPYSWGNLDCSGLVQRAYASAGVDLPRISFQQATYGRTIGREAAQPGDLVAWDNSTRNNGADHIAIYLGNNQILEAPRTGLNVRIRNLDDGEDVWFTDMSRATGG